MAHEVRNLPAYQYNEVALQLAPTVAACSSLGALLFYPMPQQFLLAIGGGVLTFVFWVIKYWGLPRVRTAQQLDLAVFCYYATCFLMIGVDYYFSHNQQAAVIVGCMISASGVMFVSIRSFVGNAIFGAGGWLLLKGSVTGSIGARETLEMLTSAPMIALVLRFAVRKTFETLQSFRLREERTVQRLQEAVQQLELEKRLRQQSESQLLHAQKTESLGLLAAGVAHDFNNALLAISAFAENIRATSAESVTQDHAGKVVTVTQQASDICRRMLTYAGRSSDQLGPVQLSTLAHDTLPLLKACAKPPVRVQLVRTSDAAVILGNATHLQQVMLNLVKNASEAYEGKGTVIVTISKRDVARDLSNVPDGNFGAPILAGKYYQLSVADNGDGMTEETKQQMFDPYFTTKERGHGFGLSTVLGVVRSHKATMIVNSVPQQGTCISIMFPKYGAQFADSNQFRIPGSPPRSQRIARRILLIDDEDLVRTPMAEMLRLMNWDVTEVNSGLAAVDLIRSGQSFSAIIMDYRMPEMNGHETLRKIRKAGCETPTVLCSGMISDPEQNAVLADFDGFLPKPFRREQLEEQLSRLVD